MKTFLLRESILTLSLTALVAIGSAVGRIFAMCGLLWLACSAALAAPSGVNLLVNGNAEAGGFSSGGGPVAVPGWTTSSKFTVVNYGAAGYGVSAYPTASSPGPADRQNQFFTGGNAAISTATQTIDVSANAADFSTGEALVDLSGWLGGLGSEGDDATLSLAFFNGNTSLGSAAIGPVTAAERGNATGLFFRTKTISVPANTTQFAVTLTITRKSGPDADGLADSLSLILRVPTVVTTTAESGPGSLRAAIPAGSVITFDPNAFSPATGPHVINLTSALPTIAANTAILGPGANIVTVQRSSIAGTPNFRIFLISGPPLSTLDVTIAGLTIANGNAGGTGGGIYNSGETLHIRDCTITGNRSLGTPGSGGGIFNAGGQLYLDHCTLAGNLAIFGGGVFSSDFGQVTASNCTFSGNMTSASQSGSLHILATEQVLVANLHSCTFSDDSYAIFADRIQGSTAQIFLDNTILVRPPGQSAFLGPGVFTSNGYNLTNGNDSAVLNKTGDRNNTDPMLGPLQDNGGPTFTHALLPGSPAIDKGNSSLTTDQRGRTRPVDDPNSASGGGNNSDIGAFEVQLPMTSPTPAPTATPTAAPGVVGNVSTRLPVGADENVLIEGFIVQGPAGSAKKIIVRAIGPSLAPFGIPDALENPTLEIRDTNNTLIATNDDWRNTEVGGIITGDQSAEIAASQLAPGNDLESAIVANLTPGAYTAIVRGSGSTVGTGVVDAYDLSATSPARLANIATRGFIQPGDKLMIAGFIIQNQPVRAVIRAIGPSLVAFGINNALADTTLQLRDQNGVIARENDNWQTDQKRELEATGLQPSHDLEAALIETIQPGQYTAQVRGTANASGIGVVQVYFLQ